MPGLWAHVRQEIQAEASTHSNPPEDSIVLNRLSSQHNKKHDRRFQCETCDKKFEYKKDLSRHRAEKHPDISPGPAWYCTYQDCKRSVESGHGFRRKDHLTRHMKSRHSSPQ